MSRKLTRSTGRPKDGCPERVRAWDLDAEGRLVVVDETGHRLFVEQNDGRFRPIGRHGQGAGEFIYPSAVAIAEDEAYVADSWNHRIQVFRIPGWKPDRCFGTIGRRKGEFFRPSGVALVDRGREGSWVVVADTNNQRLSVHNRAGQCLFVVELEGSEFPVDVAYRDGAFEVKGEGGQWKRLSY